MSRGDLAAPPVNFATSHGRRIIVQDAMMKYTSTRIAEIAKKVLGISPPSDWTGVDAVLPLIEKMREEGAIVLLKWDGERRVGAGQYTAVVQGAPLGKQFFRTDATSLEQVLCRVIEHYDDVVWRLAFPREVKE